jgi:FkbM family methyltransferase
MRHAYEALCYRLASYLRGVTQHGVYTVRSGVAKGLKRRGGFGFIPRDISREEAFLAAMDFRGKTVFDIGGYEGIYTLFFARAVGAKGRVVTFEPNPINHAVIRRNVELNGFTNVTLRSVALADRKGHADLLFPVREPARGTLWAHYQLKIAKDFQSRKLTVDIDTLDNQVAGLSAPDFIKIDVEGAELEVLRGMERVMSEHRPALFIEIHTGVDVRQVVSLLADANYEMCHVEHDAIITPDNAGALKNGHLYCCASAEIAIPNRFNLTTVVA